MPWHYIRSAVTTSTAAKAQLHTFVASQTSTIVEQIPKMRGGRHHSFAADDEDANNAAYVPSEEEQEDEEEDDQEDVSPKKRC